MNIVGHPANIHEVSSTSLTHVNCQIKISAVCPENMNLFQTLKPSHGALFLWVGCQNINSYSFDDKRYLEQALVLILLLL